MIDKRNVVSRRKEDCDHTCVYVSQIREMHDCIVGLKATMLSLAEIVSSKVSESIMERVDKRFDEKLKMFIGSQALWLVGVLGSVSYVLYHMIVKPE
jgi:hypothetical protein